MKHSITIGITLLLLMACSKEAKDPIYVNINAIIAYDGTPISGICWNIVETKSEGLIGGNINATGWELGGTTDGSGISVVEFYPKKDLDYQYDIYFDYSNMIVPVGDYEIVNGPTTFAHVNHSSENIYNIRLLPYMDIDLHFLNQNCFDINDTFKFKSFNFDEHLYFSQNQINGLPWVESNMFNGCLDLTWNTNSLAGRHVYVWEAIRNGITEQGIDTFYVAPGANNLIELFW
ncbi:MAG: hypothetical protein QNK23_03195 [Crocinitomicaceae bacterium]|nr:hypothetical protein [Crocinitomicaceae bacterium]